MSDVPKPASGAESLVWTLLGGGVDVCFANPGTSEMHFVSALDRIHPMRCVLGLFEGVVTGAADGYYRAAGRPASTLLHLGPGLSNGSANLHNARKARSGIVNIVGEHSTAHLRYDAPLSSDVPGLARPVSDWMTISAPGRVAEDAAGAILAARGRPGKVATLILPADASWGPPERVAAPRPLEPSAPVPEASVIAAARALCSGRPSMLLLAGEALRGRARELAGRISAATGCKLLSEQYNARVERGAGRVVIPQLPVPAGPALETFAGVQELILVGARAPVSFFAYPGRPSVLTSDHCVITKLADPEHDLEQALDALAIELGAAQTPPAGVAEHVEQQLPTGKITSEGLAAILAAQIPDNAFVVDEAITTGRVFLPLTTSARPHDWASIMGGSLGYGLPVAIGAAVAAPDRKVIALEGDGSAMYTPQALWTMAREGLDITILVFANRRYQVLLSELSNVGAMNPGRRALDVLSIGDPDIQWTGLARSLGVEAGRAETLEEVSRELARGLASTGPYLVEVVI
ncbi:acetolactate synthase large subunit [Phenylobacterium sp.]|jgi:acetolactate synthase-1/2/3 large subunit|uniref:acetolactate synthase large subunit n=1 Tax=Phenylobacterium sp. TaxID=1871053 RepID=UPI002E37B706|nr:acetolactate synthase large subunit [Phenylobacterium sp.]HEX3364618.1 acetolactate synthase large subunit [Phenylobacterium sp.]